MINALGDWVQGGFNNFATTGGPTKLEWIDSELGFTIEAHFFHAYGLTPSYRPVGPDFFDHVERSGDETDLAGAPIPVDFDGGIGDGAGPLDGGPIPVELDGGIGDGAGPLDGGPFPVEPDGGIGDGAKPLPDENDGLIGIPENNIDGGGKGTEGNDFFYATEGADAFIFEGYHGNDTVTGFDAVNDVLDLSGTLFDFTDVESLIAQTHESASEDGTVYGVLIETGGGNNIYIDGIGIADFVNMTIEF